MAGLILKDSVTKLMAGYPTVSDKYNIWPGTLAGSTELKFGELVKYSSTKGFYEAITTTVTLADIAGINVATNVKLLKAYGEPNAVPTIAPGEAINLLLDGYVAIKLESSAVEANIAAGKAVAVLLASGKMTTSGVINATDMPGYTFTGTYQKLTDGTYIAEVRVK